MCGVEDIMCAQVIVDRLISEVAGRQHGVVARSQLLEAGLTARQVAWRLRNGRLHHVHRGVYLVGHVVPLPRAPEMAALLACGPEAVISHRSAAAFWNLLSYPAQADVSVTVPLRRSPCRPRIEIHRADLPRRDWMPRDSLRVTNPARTILDMAACQDDYDLERLVAEAQYRRLVGEPQLRDQLDRNPGRHGAPKLRAVLDLPGGPRRTRSPAERRMLRLLREGGFQGYELNMRIHGYEVDVVWPELDFAVEIDGYDGHAGRVAFERDRLRIATLQAQGVSVMPITGRQLRNEPEASMRRLTEALRVRRRA